ncbi:thymidine kinase [Deinococcus sp.]|uniref:thymidine kinase n=1 Tax=Deinococcus sp. TaxID=47478 RepID=UPI003B59F18D
MLKSPYAGGHLEVIVGPMFSGKSEELIRRVNRSIIARQRAVVFKPAIDTRYDLTRVASHSGQSAEAVAVAHTDQARAYLSGEAGLFGPPAAWPEVVAFDEAQFFDDGLVPLALELADRGVRVILAGLDLDFRGEPFGMMPELLSRAESVEKLTAICVICGAPATRTQRLIGGAPAQYDDPVVLVGAQEAYEARCRVHHEVRRG